MKKVVTYKEKKERYCRNCGGVVGKKDKVCPNCGWDFKSKLKTTIDGGYKTSNAIVYGVLSIVFSFFPFVGIVLGIMAMVSGVRDIEKRAVICGIVGTSLTVVSSIIWIVYVIV
jgi:hypothetical protein